MPKAEFEEKTYEIGANIELGRGTSPFGYVFAPGQVLEGLLGFDAAASPALEHPVWRVIDVARPPGVRLLPRMWSGSRQPASGQLPATLISLVLQYKRPEFLSGARATQWASWRRPFYRFTRSVDQQRVLKRLERQLGHEAVVRYAAPAFWTFAELEAAQLSGRVLSRSGFVSPTALGAHRVWTYTDPGSFGLANPRSPRLPFETIQDLASGRFITVDDRRDLVVVEGGLRQHVHRVALVLGSREPKVRHDVNLWLANIRQADPFPTFEQSETLRDFATIGTVLGRIGASWYVGIRP
jgi:hypothetical protein